jgi:hypothetical protein
MKNAVFWDVTPCGSCYKRSLWGTYRLQYRGDKNWWTRSNVSVRRLLVTANVVPTSPILVTLMMEALSSSQTSVLTRATRRNIPEDAILHSHRRESLKFYIAWTHWALMQRRNVSSVRYELRFYIPEDGILLSQRRESLKSYIKSIKYTTENLSLYEVIR